MVVVAIASKRWKGGGDSSIFRLLVMTWWREGGETAQKKLKERMAAQRDPVIEGGGAKAKLS